MANSDSKIFSHGEQRAQRESGRKMLSRFGNLLAYREGVLKEETFHAMLTHERRRAERSRKPVVLVLLDSHAVPRKERDAAFVERLTSCVHDATRETDIIGWYEEGMILGVIFTEVNLQGETSTAEVLHSKVVTSLRDNLDQKLVSKLAVTDHIVPESWDVQRPDRVASVERYKDHSRKTSQKRL